jgi:anti-sigma regulatory factor (Ser/Thr protein kinase)
MTSSKLWAGTSAGSAVGQRAPCGGGRPPSASLLLELTRSHEAPARARAAVSGWWEGRESSPSQLDTLLLLVSEVVTNAVIHAPAAAQAPIRFLASVSGQTVRVAVTDSGDGFTPTARDHRSMVGGYGLLLVAREATRWGVDRVGGTRVWFEL